MLLLEIARMTEDDAREHLEQLRWPNGVRCAFCNETNVIKLQGSSTRPGCYKCRDCRKRFTVTVGTIMHRSHLSLVKWVLAFHLVCSAKKGISAHQLHRVLGITYKTAWHLDHRIRHCMKEQPLAGMLSGTVEVDETYVGGKKQGGKRGRGSENKTPVVVLVERDGVARSLPVNNVGADELKGAIRETVDKESTIMTDEWPSYTGIGEEFDGGHHVIKHKDKVYVDGDIHTNTAESFFSLIKRGYIGTFHKMSKQHLHRYVDEFTFRWNTRKLDDEQRTKAALSQFVGKRLTYKQPIKALQEKQDSLK